MNKTYVAIHMDFIAMIILMIFIVLSIIRDLNLGDWVALSPRWISLLVYWFLGTYYRIAFIYQFSEGWKIDK